MLPTIHVKLRKDKVRDNKQAIVLQVYFDKKQKQIFTGLYIEEKFFDKGKILSSAPNAAWYRQMIKNKVNELEGSFLKQSVEKGSIDLTPEPKQTRLSFFEYATKFFMDMRHRNSATYIMRCLAKVKEFEEFCGEKKSFEAITPQVLKDFEDYLFKVPNSRNTINGKFKRIKEVFIDAEKHGVITTSPFKIFEPITYKQPKREFLTIEEIQQIKEAELPDELEQVRNYFLLACYTGLRFSDMEKFDKTKSIITNRGVQRIIIGTTKTGEIVSIKLSPIVKQIVNKINQPLPSNTHTNRLLKIIGQVAKIQKPLTFHLARHAAAVNLASAGVPIEAVARILGHQDIRTTAIYFKITDKKLDDFMDNYSDYSKGTF